MQTTVTLKNLGAFAGATNLQLFLRKTSDNTLLAAGGDTGVDASSIGSFAWTVAEEIPSEQLLARIYEGSTETAANIVIDSVLNVGFTEIGQEAAELNTEYLFDDGFGRKAIKANVTHYQGTLQGNGDLPAKLDAIRTNTNTDIPALISSEAVKTAAILEDTGTTLPAQITAFVTKVRKFFQLSLRKDAAIATDNAAELTELNASGGSGAGGYLSTTDSQEAIRDSIAGVISSAIASAGVATTVTGIPTFLRVGDARTVANGGAIAVRLYDADDDSLLFGLGTQLFADATITFSLRRGGNDGTEGTEDAVIPCTWVASGGDGYVRIAYEGDALDDCDAMDKLKEKDCHRWGIKFQWGDDDPITPVYGTVSVLRKIVSTQ